MWEYGLLHILILGGTFTYLPPLYAVIVLSCIPFIISFALQLFGLHPYNYADAGMAYESCWNNNNLGGYFIIAPISFEEFQDLIFKKAILPIPKMRCVASSFLGVKCWREIKDLQSVKEQISIVEEEVQEEKGWVNFLEEMVNQQMDHAKPLWEMRLLEKFINQDGEIKSVVFVRMHHSFIDGMGFVSLMDVINDQKYRLKVDKKFPQLGWASKVFFFISGLFYFPYLAAVFGGYKTDPSAGRINELAWKDTNNWRFYISETIPFGDVKKWYKAYGEKVTFNDYMLGVMSVSFDKWYKSSGVVDAKLLCIGVSVNTRGLPKSIDDFKLENDSIALKFPLPLISDFEKALKITSKSFKKHFTQFKILSLKYFMKTYCCLPVFLQKKLIVEISSNIDLVYSNVPLSSEPWCILGKKVSKIGVFPHTQHKWKIFYVVTTYWNEMRISISANENLKLDPQKLLELGVATIKRDIAQRSRKNNKT
jgi:NRPS condensation-like uncharacterized protein